MNELFCCINRIPPLLTSKLPPKLLNTTAGINGFAFASVIEPLLTLIDLNGNCSVPKLALGFSGIISP